MIQHPIDRSLNTQNTRHLDSNRRETIVARWFAYLEKCRGRTVMVDFLHRLVIPLENLVRIQIDGEVVNNRVPPCPGAV